jgi:hypothetical protein
MAIGQCFTLDSGGQTCLSGHVEARGCSACSVVLCVALSMFNSSDSLSPLQESSVVHKIQCLHATTVCVTVQQLSSVLHLTVHAPRNT